MLQTLMADLKEEESARNAGDTQTQSALLQRIEANLENVITSSSSKTVSSKTVSESVKSIIGGGSSKTESSKTSSSKTSSSKTSSSKTSSSKTSSSKTESSSGTSNSISNEASSSNGDDIGEPVINEADAPVSNGNEAIENAGDLDFKSSGNDGSSLMMQEGMQCGHKSGSETVGTFSQDTEGQSKCIEECKKQAGGIPGCCQVNKKTGKCKLYIGISAKPSTKSKYMAVDV
jgi:hypothetical protein